MSYSNGLLHSSSSRKTPQRGLPGVGFELTDDGNYDIDGKRLTNVAEPVDGKDATTKAYVDEKTSHNTSNLYHLRNSFEFYDSSGTKLALSTDNITGLLSDYKHGYYKISKDSDESTYSKVSIEIKNNLPNSTYSALFYLYGYNNNSIITGDDLGPILFGARGINYHVLWYTDDDDSLQTKNHTKGLIWFTADGDGSTEIELRFFNKSITHFVVLSRCVEGKVNLGFSIDIFNVAHNSTGTFYFENINMNNREIKNLGGPTDDGDAANKKYVDDGDDKLLPRDGSKTMTGDLNMNNKRIINAGGMIMKNNGSSLFDLNDNKIIGLRDPADDTDGANKKYVDTENAKQDIAIADKANKSYVDGEIAKVNIDTTPLLLRDGSRSMTGDLDMDHYNIRNCGILLMNSLGVINMNNGNIINLKDPQPSDINNAASVNFVNNTINNSNVIINGVIDKKIQESEERSIQAVQQENVFKKVMTDSLFILEDDDIHQVAKIDKDFHKVNQQTYQFKIDYDSSIGYYSTRLGINVVYLPIGYYTIVFEMYFSNKIDVDNTSINANSGTLSVNKINTKNSSNHTRSVVNFYKNMIHLK